MASYGDNYDQNDYNRPRRSDPQSVAYLRSLPLDEASAEHEISTCLEAKKKRQEATRAREEEDGNEEEEEEEVEYPQSLAAAHAALTEIEKELASLSCDEHGSQIIETIARVTTSPSMGRSERAARRLLAGLAGYHLHLACHRFGSHVVQTILSCAAAAGGIGEDKDAAAATAKWLTEDVDDDADGDDADLPSVTELILAAADELLPHSRELAVHVCGSHVLRTLLCVLGGVELVSSRGDAGGAGRLQLGGTRRGKAKDPKAKNKKKKKRRNPQMEESEAAAGGGGGAGNDLMQPIACSRIDTDSTSVKDALRQAITTLNGSVDGGVRPGGPSELQKLACHPSAGPLLAVLLRVLTHSSADVRKKKTLKMQEADDNKSMSDHRLGIVPPEPTFAPDSAASNFAKAILCWDEQIDDATKQQYAGDVVFGLSGEPRGSHVLESILRSSDDGFFDEICRAGRFYDVAAFREYAEHNVSNFVMQSLFVTIRSRQQADELLKCLEPLVSSGYILNKSNRRGGLLWRASEMCAKYNVGQDGLLHAIRVGFTALAGNNNDESGSNKETEVGADTSEGMDGKKMRHKKRKREEEEALLSFKECVPLLIGLKAPEKEGGRAMLDVAGARTIFHILHFPPKLCRDALDGITKGFSAQELEWIANDGLGSRCIMDAITEGNNEKKQKALRQLLEKLSGRWVALSVERVGHHLVQNLFRALTSLDDKATLACELARGINRLGGNAMGRKVMATCAVKEFMEGEDTWKEEVRKQARKEEILKELVEDVIDVDAAESSRKGDDKAGEDAGEDDDIDDNNEERPSGKKKLKRKKKKAKKEEE